MLEAKRTRRDGINHTPRAGRYSFRVEWDGAGAQIRPVFSNPGNVFGPVGRSQQDGVPAV